MRRINEKKLVIGIIVLGLLAAVLFSWSWGSSADVGDRKPAAVEEQVQDQADEAEAGVANVGGSRRGGGNAGQADGDDAQPGGGGETPTTEPEQGDPADGGGGGPFVHPTFPCNFCGGDGPVVVDPIPPGDGDPQPPEPPDYSCKPVEGQLCP